MSDLKMDLKSKDLILVNGDLAITSAGSESIAQRITIKLGFFLAEWFLDVTFGIPYFQEIFVKPVVASSVDAIFKSGILDTPGVLELVEYNSDFNQSQRKFSLTFEVLSDTKDSVAVQIPLVI